MIYLIIGSMILLLHYLLFINSMRKGINLLKMRDYKTEEKEEIFVSIIVAFRNESNVLENLVDSINHLDYPGNKFELIFVNDNSEDNSVSIIQDNIAIANWRILHSNSVKLERAHKKTAITYAIDQADGDIIFLTDADCKLPQNWLRTMLQCLDGNTALVSGPVTFEEESNIFEKLQKLEYSGLSLAGAGLIGIGKPKICSAANLAFNKSVFYEVGGYEDNLNLSSGDDELLMQKIAAQTKYKINYCMNKDAVVLTRSNKTLSDFNNQRKRWASKSLFYKDNLFISRLCLIILFYLLLLILAPLSIFLGSNYLLLLILLLTGKTLIEFTVLQKGEGIFYGKGLLKYIFIAELLQVPYIIYATLGGLFGNYEWKGREVER